MPPTTDPSPEQPASEQQPTQKRLEAMEVRKQLLIWSIREHELELSRQRRLRKAGLAEEKRGPEAGGPQSATSGERGERGARGEVRSRRAATDPTADPVVQAALLRPEPPHTNMPPPQRKARKAMPRSPPQPQPQPQPRSPPPPPQPPQPPQSPQPTPRRSARKRTLRTRFSPSQLARARERALANAELAAQRAALAAQN